MFELLIVSALVLLLVAIFSAWIAYRRTASVALSSMLFTVFFSFGIAIDRIAIPLPALIFLPLAVHDVLDAPPCVPTSEGCYSETDPVGNLRGFFVLFSIQWAFWAVVFSLWCKAFPGRGRKRSQ